MPSFSNILSFVLIAITCASFSEAAPSSNAAKHATHRKRIVGRRAAEVESFYPESTFKTFGAGDENASVTASLVGPSGVEGVTVAALQSYLNIELSKLSFKSGHSFDGSDFGYVRQQHDGIPFANAVANVVVKNSKLVSVGSSFVDSVNIASSQPTFDVNEAIKVAEDLLDGSHNSDVEPALEYLARPDGSVVLTHVIQIKNDEAHTWYEAFVDAHEGKLLSINDFTAHASYNAIPIDRFSVLEGYELLTNPEDQLASPLGWHNDGSGETNTTAGNNVLSFKGIRAATTTQSSDGPTFNYTYDTSLEPEDEKNVDASRVQAFYLANKLHDIFYRYGFTETTYNFQNDNFGKGAREHDRLLMMVQHSAGTDNANIAVPPDGQSPECHMYVFTFTTPKRDGVFETSIPVHEITHGLTSRMTGGGTARCLQTAESGGLGEGWSDALADWSQQKAEIKDFVTGAYVLGDRPGGIRQFPYSTSAEVNPLRANMLHNVHAALLEAHGYSDTAFTNPDGSEGNVVFLHLFIDALPIQPWNPTFLQARDAWIQADENRYGGSHKCLLWKAFASRGLGVNAANFMDGEGVPEECN
ncbi:hypothetical protein V5O48_010075 [Marasmius crinis-equi]|uniref:Extracellular metalloproteinase n=1 Tax=Marasmius crinis-equi TaxID=585013 RepID=A0ABR3F9G8_9AGAR